MGIRRKVLNILQILQHQHTGHLVWKEQVKPKLQKRNQMRGLQVEATTCQVYISAGDESTENLVVQFYTLQGHGSPWWRR